MIPAGGGFQAGLQALSSAESITSHARKATEWVQWALNAVKVSPDNIFGDDDEAIAGEILAIWKHDTAAILYGDSSACMPQGVLIANK
jgi:hypothetical protein